MIEFFFIGIIFLLSYLISFFINLSETFNNIFIEEEKPKPPKPKLIKIQPKNKSNDIQKKLIEEYLYWLFNSDYLNYKDYPNLFPSIYLHYNPKTKLDWQEIFIEIKKDLHHLI